MKKTRPTHKASALLLALSQLFLFIPAFGAGFQHNETSPSMQGAAIAGAAAAKNDVTSLFNNPATLTTLLKNQIYIGASGILPRVGVSDAQALHTVNIPGVPPSIISGHVSGASSQNNINNASLVPDAYLSFRLNPNVVAGISITEPFHLNTQYSNDSVLRYSALTSKINSLDINPNIAFEANKNISIAAGLQVQYLQARFSNFNGPYTDSDPINSIISATSPTHFQGDDWALGYTLGALYQPNNSTRLGIGYRSKISNKLEGQGAYMTVPGDVTPAPSQSFWFNGQSSVYMPITTPAVLTAGLEQDINDWTIKATAQFNFWSSFESLSVSMPQAYAINSTMSMNWNNAWFGSIGAAYHKNESLILRAGLAYDQTPTNSHFSNPLIPDSDIIWAALGISYVMTSHVSIDAAYGYIFIKNQNLYIDQAYGKSINSTLPLEANQANAHYNGSKNILSLGIRYHC